MLQCLLIDANSIRMYQIYDSNVRKNKWNLSEKFKGYVMLHFIL